MYNGGKNNDYPSTLPIGNAYIGYDCSTKKLCVAAYLNDATLLEPPSNCYVVRSSSSSWVSIGAGNNKLSVPDTNYVRFKDRDIGKCLYAVG